MNPWEDRQFREDQVTDVETARLALRWALEKVSKLEQDLERLRGTVQESAGREQIYQGRIEKLQEKLKEWESVAKKLQSTAVDRPSLEESWKSRMREEIRKEEHQHLEGKIKSWEAEWEHLREMNKQVEGARLQNEREAAASRELLSQREAVILGLQREKLEYSLKIHSEYADLVEKVRKEAQVKVEQARQERFKEVDALWKSMEEERRQAFEKSLELQKQWSELNRKIQESAALPDKEELRRQVTAEFFAREEKIKQEAEEHFEEEKRRIMDEARKEADTLKLLIEELKKLPQSPAPVPSETPPPSEAVTTEMLLREKEALEQDFENRKRETELLRDHWKKEKHLLEEELSTRRKEMAAFYERWKMEKAKLEESVKDQRAALEKFEEEAVIRKNREAAGLSPVDERAKELHDLSFGIIHQLRNPIGIIRAMAQYILENGGLKDEAMNAIETILRNSDGMNEKVEQLSAFTTPMESDGRKETLKGVLAEAVDLVRERCERQGVEVRASVEEDISAVEVEKNRMELAVLNLALNSIEAMPEGGKLEVRMVRRDEDGRVSVCVSDTGHGIAPEHISEVIKPFFTTKKGGMGLGLSLSKKIIEAMGGSLSLESEPGKGTRVCLIFTAQNGTIEP